MAVTASTDPSAAACPCGTGRAYGGCCGRWHAGPEHLLAPTPEALMRSRYCAFVLGLGAYLQDTWHASTRPGTEPSFEPGQKWLRLEVKRAPTPGVGADPSADSTAATGEVEFVAVSKFGGKAMRLHERSRFVLDAGRWLYVDGHVQ